MKAKKLRTLSILMPLVSLLVAAGIVRFEYARRDQLTREVAQAEREYIQLQKRMPKNSPSAAPSHDEHHDDHDHEDH